MVTNLSLPAYPRLLRIKEVKAIIGLSRSTIYKLIANEQFPSQAKLSARTVAWPDTEILEWVQDRMAERAISKPPLQPQTVPLKKWGIIA
jgi:prophage regulatory protein